MHPLQLEKQRDITVFVNAPVCFQGGERFATIERNHGLAVKCLLGTLKVPGSIAGISS